MPEYSNNLDYSSAIMSEEGQVRFLPAILCPLVVHPSHPQIAAQSNAATELVHTGMGSDMHATHLYHTYPDRSTCVPYLCTLLLFFEHANMTHGRGLHLAGCLDLTVFELL